MSAQDDLEQLRLFVLDVVDVCSETIYQHPGWLRPELVDHFYAAWQEVLHQIQRLNVDYELLLGDETLDERLAAVGLSGAQLQLKLATYYLYRREHRERPNRRRLSRLLRTADVILGSLVKVVAAVEPLKEFKETIEASLAFWRRRPKPPD